MDTRFLFSFAFRKTRQNKICPKKSIRFEVNPVYETGQSEDSPISGKEAHVENSPARILCSRQFV